MGGGALAAPPAPPRRSVADYYGNQAQQRARRRGSGRWHCSSAGALPPRGRQGWVSRPPATPTPLSWYTRGLAKPGSREALYRRGADGPSCSRRLWGSALRPGLARALRH